MSEQLTTPDSILPHEPKYKAAAWQEYDVKELGCWVHLFVKRAGMRSDKAKAEKDLADAQNYLNMMQAHIDAAKAKVEAA